MEEVHPGRKKVPGSKDVKIIYSEDLRNWSENLREIGAENLRKIGAEDLNEVGSKDLISGSDIFLCDINHLPGRLISSRSLIRILFSACR